MRQQAVGQDIQPDVCVLGVAHGLEFFHHRVKVGRLFGGDGVERLDVLDDMAVYTWLTAMGVNFDKAHRVLALLIKAHCQRCAAVTRVRAQLLWPVDMS